MKKELLYGDFSDPISRRKVLELLKNVTFGAILVPDLVNFLFLPAVEAPVSEKEHYEKLLLEELKPFFPNIEFVIINLPPSETSIAGFMDSFFFWLKKLDPMIKKSEQAKVDTSLPDMYQNTVKSFSFTFMQGVAQTISTSVEGEVIEIWLNVDEADPSSLAAELIHPFQETYSVNKGISVVNSEGPSTAIHYQLMVEWLAHNQSNPQEAVVMPIFDTNGVTVHNPSVEGFNFFLSLLIDLYHEAIWNSPLGQYKKEFIGEDRLGQSNQYNRRHTFLQSRLDEITSQYYQNSIEEYSAVFARAILDRGLSLEQIVVLSGLINHGVFHQYLAADIAVIDAYNDLKAQGFVADAEKWEANKAEFTAPTVEDLPLNVVFALKNEPYTKGRLTLEAFQVITSVPADKAFFGSINVMDRPTAKLFFQITRNNGEKVWYEQQLDVSPHDPNNPSPFYAIELPSSLWVRDGVLFWSEELNGKDMVVQVTQEELLGAPLGTTQFFEVKGEFESVAVAEAKIAPPIEEMLEPVTAPVPVAVVAQAEVAASEINRVEYARLVDALDKLQLEDTIVREPYVRPQND